MIPSAEGIKSLTRTYEKGLQIIRKVVTAELVCAAKRGEYTTTVVGQCESSFEDVHDIILSELRSLGYAVEIVYDSPRTEGSCMYMNIRWT
jgi:hypothetical protein